MNAESGKSLAITGMTCAACAGRVEKALRAVPGVALANVNLATERAYVSGAATVGELVAAIEASGYGATNIDTPEGESDEEAARAAQARHDGRLLIVAAVFTLPLLAPMTLDLIGVDWMMPALWQFALALPVQFGPGWRFYTGAYKALRAGSANMDVLVALGTSAAFGFSLWQWLGAEHGHAHLYFESGAAVITLVMLGKWMEARARHGTSNAIHALAALRPQTARVERSGAIIEVPSAEIVVGDIVVVRPGESFAVDGEVVSGSTEVDESLVTGESRPISKTMGGRVIGGSVNSSGLVSVRTTAIGKASALGRIMAMVEAAQGAKAPVQRLVDEVSAVFVPVVLGLALLTFIIWWGLGNDAEQGLLAAVSVLVIACPCALGLATPAALVAGIGTSARAGILIRDPEALEKSARINTVVFDKTGTLTEGRPVVVATRTTGALTDLQLHRLAASAEQGSEHPLARAVRALVPEADLPRASFANARPGFGFTATVEGRHIALGNRALMKDLGIDLGDLDASGHAAEEEGRTVVWVAETAPGQHVLGWMAISDKLREGAAEAIAALNAQGFMTAMLSGDNRATAERIGRQLGLARIEADARPDVKAARIAALQREGRRVAMVGDGVNDAPALAAADLGIAVASATDATMATADIALLRSDPRLVIDALDIARATLAKVRQNLFWAFAYNVVALPLAMLGWLSPMIAGGAMALSSVTVVSNALLLTRWTPKLDTRKAERKPA